MQGVLGAGAAAGCLGIGARIGWFARRAGADAAAGCLGPRLRVCKATGASLLRVPASSALDLPLAPSTPRPNLALSCQTQPRPAVEEGIQVCKRLGVPKDDDTLAGLEALQEGLQTLLKEAAKQGGKDSK